MGLNTWCPPFDCKGCGEETAHVDTTFLIKSDVQVGYDAYCKDCFFKLPEAEQAKAIE